MSVISLKNAVRLEQNDVHMVVLIREQKIYVSTPACMVVVERTENICKHTCLNFRPVKVA
jgi:hypothetical protein